MEGRKDGLFLKPPGAFEYRTSELVIKCLDYSVLLPESALHFKMNSSDSLITSYKIEMVA